MPARLILVRHGPSAHVHEAAAVDRAGVQRWRDAYDAVGIHTGSRPPDALMRLAAEAAHIISSDLLRAVGSAEALAPNRRIHVSSLLREAPLAIPPWPTRLPLGLWDILMHIGWGVRILRGTDAAADDRARADAAAEWLERLVADGSTALVVTHGVFRRLLASHLLGRGWTGSGRVGGYAHWSAWSFSDHGSTHAGVR